MRQPHETMGGSWLAGVLLATASTLAAAEEQKTPLTYEPPERGAASTRVGGGTRGTAAELESVSVLAPDHVGWTTSAQPTLYWFLSKTLSKPVEITVIDDEAVVPFLRLELPPPIEAGIHALDLGALGFTLEPGKAYQWFVNVIHDRERRSGDNAAGGFVQFVAEPPGWAPEADTDTRIAAYAANGLWYDAVHALTRQIEMAPEPERYRRQRLALLEQVGLDDVARYEAARLP